MPEVLTAESFENVPLINAHRGDALGVYPGRNGTFIAMLSCALFSILFNALAYQQEVKVGFCFNATRYPDGPTYLAPAFSRLGYLFELAAFFAFCWDKRILFAAIVYTISEGFSATLSKLRYRSCAHVVPLLGQVFQREVFQTAVTYFMRAVTAAVGTYKDAGLHVDIFAWMVLAVLVEFAVEIFVRTAGAWHFGTAEVFTYFNIKLAIFIFEIALDQDWVTMLYGERHQGNPWATFTFFLWMAANFGLVVYYNVPSNQRWDDSVGEQAWEAGWWVIAGTQMTITTGLCAKACHRRWDLGFGEPF